MGIEIRKKMMDWKIINKYIKNRKKKKNTNGKFVPNNGGGIPIYDILTWLACNGNLSYTYLTSDLKYSAAKSGAYNDFTVWFQPLDLNCWEMLTQMCSCLNPVEA